MNKQTRQ